MFIYINIFIYLYLFIYIYLFIFIYIPIVDFETFSLKIDCFFPYQPLNLGGMEKKRRVIAPISCQA